MTDSHTVLRGRRDRNMKDKRDRIFRAAAALFAERGYGAVSTQEVSDRADVAAGTLFRYAASKGELLLMVYNEELRAALDEGERRASAQGDVAAAIFEMVAPIIERARTSVENSVVYQRELLFGGADEQFRAAGLAMIASLETRIAARLREAVPAEDPVADHSRSELAGSAVFAATHLAVARASTGAHADSDPLDDLRGQIRLIVDGYLANTH